jgi:hypothetical protein
LSSCLRSRVTRGRCNNQITIFGEQNWRFFSKKCYDQNFA